METSCNRDSLGSVGLVCRNSTTEAANRHWLGQGIRRRKRRNCLAGIRRRKRRIGTDLDKEFDGGGGETVLQEFDDGSGE